ncbi:hypothetical protein EsH8_III_001431 [Colletotrichum jinshuiense]
MTDGDFSQARTTRNPDDYKITSTVEPIDSEPPSAESLLEKFREADDEFLDIDFSLSTMRLRSCLADAEAKPTYDTSEVSELSSILASFQEAETDNNEELGLECAILESSDILLDGAIHKAVLTFDEYLEKDIIQQIHADLEEQGQDAGFRSSKYSTDGRNFQTVTNLDCRRYTSAYTDNQNSLIAAGDTYGDIPNSPVVSLDSPSLNQRLRRKNLEASGYAHYEAEVQDVMAELYQSGEGKVEDSECASLAASLLDGFTELF